MCAERIKNIWKTNNATLDTNIWKTHVDNNKNSSRCITESHMLIRIPHHVCDWPSPWQICSSQGDLHTTTTHTSPLNKICYAHHKQKLLYSHKITGCNIKGFVHAGPLHIPLANPGRSLVKPITAKQNVSKEMCAK